MSKELQENTIKWIRILNKHLPDPEVNYDLYPTYKYPEFELHFFDGDLTILAMSWHYQFRSFEKGIEFLQEWKLI